MSPAAGARRSASPQDRSTTGNVAGSQTASLSASISPEVTSFARDVGDEDPITVVGGRTHWHIGGLPDACAREICAPSGIWEHEPSEMTVRCGAGTTVAELAAHLAPGGQMVPFDAVDDGATVGGLLACGVSGHRRLRYGHVRDLVLQTRHVDAAGKVVTAGGPTVKNVSGYDLPRLLVGSLGTLGLTAEVILRTLPVPPTSQWLTGSGDPFAAFDLLYRPSSVLWDGAQTWILLEGVPADVEAEAKKLEPMGFCPVDGPPPVPATGRESMRPADLRTLTEPNRCNAGGGLGETWLAEVGVGAVHRSVPTVPAQVSPANAVLMAQIKSRLDPTGRLNPGRSLW